MNTQPVSRRTFLQSAASGTLAIGSLSYQSVTALAESPSAKANINFGFSLYGMRSLKTSTALKTCAEIGYDSVELVCTKGWPCDPENLSAKARQDLRRQLQDLDLKLPGLMENLHVVVDDKQHRNNLDRLQAASELGHALSPKQPPVIETILGGKPNQWEEIKTKMIRGLQDWAKVAEKAKTIIAVKAHVSGALHTPTDARWLAGEVGSPWIKLAYDYSHFQLREFDLKKSLEAMIDQSVFIHVKDKTGKAVKFRFLLPGDGDIDYVTYFKLLKKHGYRGGVVVEVSGQIHGKPGYDPLEAAKRSYNNLSPAFRETGLRNNI